MIRGAAFALFMSAFVACSVGEAAAPSANVSGSASPTDPEPADVADRDAASRSEAAVPTEPRDAAGDVVIEPCLDDGTVLLVSSTHVSAYVIDGAEDPSLVLCRGRTYTFRLDAPFHPFWIKTQPTLGTDDAFSDGVTGNGIESGDVVFGVPANAPSLLHYICEFHDGMQGELIVRD